MQTTQRPYIFFLAALLGLAGLICFGSCGKTNHPTAPTLHISSFSPSSGILGTRVVITGSDFSPSLTGNTVTFNGKTAIVIAAAATSLTVEVPVLAGNGKISVQVGSKTTSSANDFTYIYSV